MANRRYSTEQTTKSIAVWSELKLSSEEDKNWQEDWKEELITFHLIAAFCLKCLTIPQLSGQAPGATLG